MPKKATCDDCAHALTKDEAALNRKMLGRTTTVHYCIRCLADLLDCSSSDLEIKIMEFREQGCSLFL
jgi:hypothetical protein